VSAMPQAIEPHYSSDRVRLFHGDCREVMASFDDASVDAIVTDPPYELKFMGKGWDGSGIAYDPVVWGEALRVLKPGGHLLAFGGTRTWHRLAVAIEDAGFEVRDSIAWMYGSGFPKSLDVSKAIDKAAGVERQKVPATGGLHKNANLNDDGWSKIGADDAVMDSPTPATPAAQQWEGWGTALKPAFEPIVVARKPLIGTVAENVLRWGTGALNIDGCRIATTDALQSLAGSFSFSGSGGANETGKTIVKRDAGSGRWPANVILDESQAAKLDRQSGDRPTSKPGQVIRRREPADYESESIGAESRPAGSVMVAYGDTGGASRFFYVPKANKRERPNVDGVAHPTVKPLALMRYLINLVTPPGGMVLDPFAGSGATIEAAILEGKHAVGIELTDEYLPLIRERISRQTDGKLL